jgi:hypothetical protein
MMNNEDLYGTANVRAMSKLSVRSEGHTLRLASASDLWCADYQIKHSFSTICTMATRG